MYRIAEGHDGKPATWFSVRSSSPRKALKAFLNEEETVWDTDSSGSHDSTWAVVDEDGLWACFKVHHEWWWEDWFTENRHVANSFSLKPITREEACIPAERDWLDIRQRWFPEPESMRWPPKELPKKRLTTT